MLSLHSLNEIKKPINIACWLLTSIPVLCIFYGYFFSVIINPFDYLIVKSGQWAFYFFVLSYAVSPACRALSSVASKYCWSKGKRLSDWNFIIYQRKMLGLNSFYYAFAHFAIYFYFEIDFSLAELWLEVNERYFIGIGFLSLVILSILALTSLEYFQRKLKRKWKYLHQSVNIIAFFLVAHIVIADKNLSKDSIIVIGMVVILTVERLFYLTHYLKGKRDTEAIRLTRQR